VSFGITVADSAGNIVLDVSDRVGTLIGVYTRSFNFTGGSFTDTITDSAFNNGSPFYIITKSPNVEGTGDLDIPSDITLTFSGTTYTINIAAPSLGSTNGTLIIYYGYF
jgi:hypothetical protein